MDVEFSPLPVSRPIGHGTKRSAMTTTAARATASTAAPGSPTFAFPPMYHFPPFFTLQRNAQTQTAQLTQWTSLVLEYCRHFRVFTLDCEGAWERALEKRRSATADDGGALFRNPSIDRQLNSDAIRTVFKAMVDRGDATWYPALGKTPKGAEPIGNGVLVFWRRPEEWGDLIYTWVTNTGQNGSIMTFFELTEGDLVQGQDFFGLPEPLLRLALATLESQGKARVFEGTEAGEGLTGVKFA